jgi:hypothetical protein
MFMAVAPDGEIRPNILHGCPICGHYHSSNEIRLATIEVFGFLSADLFDDMTGDKYGWTCPSCRNESGTSKLFLNTLGDI